MTTNWVTLMTELGQDFARRAADHDQDDSFVAENYAKLREVGAFGAGVPAELGGGGASHAEVCGMVRELARHCGSTGLAFAMHSHLVGTMSAAWRAGNKMPEAMLKRVASEGAILVSSGASDWLSGSGKLEKVEGGFKMNGRKIFGSGFALGRLPDDHRRVRRSRRRADGHPLPAVAEGRGGEGAGQPGARWGCAAPARTTWRSRTSSCPTPSCRGCAGRRGSGTRPCTRWCWWRCRSSTAAYLGVAQSARAIALELAGRKKDDPVVQELAGELENLFVTLQITHQSMLEVAATMKPGPEATSAMAVRRNIFVKAAIALADKALELAGGAGFYRAAGLERCFRDLQGARFHPIPEKAQTRLTGRLLLGLDLA